MAIKDYRIEKFSKPVSAMPDNPTREGHTAKEIKEWFDSNSTNELKESVNGIIDHIEMREAEEDINFSKKADIKNVIEKDSNEEYTPTEATHPANKSYVDNAIEAYADYDEERVDLLLINKADKTNVIEKDSTVAYTPTAGTHPANKGYVDKAINEKISQLGAGDMAKAVYDPQGKNKDIFAEMNNYLPKTTTPDAIGAANAMELIPFDDVTITCGAANLNEITFVNDNFSSRYSTFYYKDEVGIVHFSGCITANTLLAGGNQITTLPAGFRPPSQIHAPAVIVKNGGYLDFATAKLYIAPTGFVSIDAPTAKTDVRDIMFNLSYPATDRGVQ